MQVRGDVFSFFSFFSFFLNVKGRCFFLLLLFFFLKVRGKAFSFFSLFSFLFKGKGGGLGHRGLPRRDCQCRWLPCLPGQSALSINIISLFCRTRSPRPANSLVTTSSAASASTPGCKGKTFPSHLWEKAYFGIFFFFKIHLPSFLPGSKDALFVEQLSTPLWSGARAKPTPRSSSSDANKKVTASILREC